MVKKKKKKQVAKKRPRKRSKRRLSSFWRRRQDKIKKVVIWGLAPAALLVVALLVVSYFSGRAREQEKMVYLSAAREQFLRSDLAEAQLSYRRARNAAPNDKGLAREVSMVEAMANMMSGGSLGNAVAATIAVLDYDSSSVTAHVNLARLHNERGDLPRLYEHAHAALRAAAASGETLATLVAANYIGYCFRQQEAYDSAYFYSRKAAVLAEVTGDTFDLALTKSGLGFSALEVDSLEQAAQLFAAVENLGDDTSDPFFVLSQLGWADYFYRVGAYDSCLARASYVENLYRDQPYNPNSAYASQLIGKALAGEGKSDEAVIWLAEAAESYRAVSGYSPLIDTFNHLGEAYLGLKDYVSARKYYLAASRLAQAYGVPVKSKLNVNINNLLLNRLPSADYLEAGNEGEQLAAEIIAEMDLR